MGLIRVLEEHRGWRKTSTSYLYSKPQLERKSLFRGRSVETKTKHGQEKRNKKVAGEGGRWMSVEKD